MWEAAVMEEKSCCCWKEMVFDLLYAGPNPSWGSVNSYWQEISLNGIVWSGFF